MHRGGRDGGGGGPRHPDSPRRGGRVDPRDVPHDHGRDRRGDWDSRGGYEYGGGGGGAAPPVTRDHHYPHHARLDHRGMPPATAAVGNSGSRWGHAPRSGARGAPPPVRRPLFRFALQDTESIDPKHSINRVPIDEMPVFDVWNHLKDWQAKVAVHSREELRHILSQRRKVPETILAAMLRLGVLRTPVPGLEHFVTPISGGGGGAAGAGAVAVAGAADGRDHHYPQPQRGAQASPPVDPRRKRRRDDPPLDPRKRM